MKSLITKQGTLFLIALSLFTLANAQAKKKSIVKVTGQMGLYGDFYKMKSDTVGAVKARRPSFLGRAVVNTTFSIKDFSLPITLSLASNQQSAIIQAPLPMSGFNINELRRQIGNPLNRIGIAPKYKWMQVLLGSQIPNYSKLSVGDLSVFGAGLNLTPGKFRFSCFVGKYQLAVEEDTTKNITGIYARKIYSAKIGLGHEDSSHLYLIMSYMADDTSSLDYRPSSLLPQTGTMSSIDYRINLGKKLYVSGELAGSAFTRNMMSPEVKSFSPAIPAFIFIPTYSSRFDYAGILNIGKTGKVFGIRTSAKYYGDGFVPLGYPFMQMDRLEVSVNPRFNLFQSKFQLSGSVGRRVNNLSGIRGATSTQDIGAANLNIQFSPSFSLSANYSNFGFRNTNTNDTFKVEMVTNSWSVSPSLLLSNEVRMHTISLMYSQNDFVDFNTISGSLNNNEAMNALVSYSFGLMAKPLSVTTVLSYFDNKSSIGKIKTKSANVSLGYSFFKRKLSTSAGLTFSENTFNNLESGFQVLQRMSLKYRIKKKIRIGLTGSINLFEYGVSRPGISYRENLLRTFITYKF